MSLGGPDASFREFAGTTARIGQVAELFSLTPRAIRHYEACGLISSGRDRHNFRVFDAKARKRLQIIAELRRTGLPLEEIREVLNRADGSWREAVLQALHSLADHRQQLEDQLLATREAEAWMKREPPSISAPVSEQTRGDS